MTSLRRCLLAWAFVVASACQPAAGGPTDASPPSPKDAGGVGPDATRLATPDAGRHDASALDSGREDAGQPDATVGDASVADSGTPDAARADASAADAGAADATAGLVPGDPLSGSGEVVRTALTRTQLFSSLAPAGPVDDTAGFALPAGAAQPSEAFEGTLDLSRLAASGGFKDLLDPDAYVTTGVDSAWKHLPQFSMQFVQNGSWFIPARQGLSYTGSPAWNYLVGPGRVWTEKDDQGYERVSFPFALVERNQNCVHNGEMTFLFSNTLSPNVSHLAYQITQETCGYWQFDMWGEVPASYTPQAVPNAAALRAEQAAEVSQRLPTKPFSALAVDYPRSGVDLAAFTKNFLHPEDITAYGLYLDGTNYLSACQTRYGTYAFCSEMRLPSYSTAKSTMAGIATMRLGQQFGTGVYAQLIKDYVPEYVDGGAWKKVTWDEASNMATGNYLSAAFESDEDGAAEGEFMLAEAYADKIHDAFALFPSVEPPGATWVYHTHDTFILTQAMDAYLKAKLGNGADIFDLVRDEVFVPLEVSKGALTTLRTDNAETGRPMGGFGLFFIADDVAKIGRFLASGTGLIGSAQVLDPARLSESLFRSPGGADMTLPDSAFYSGAPPVANTYHYRNYFWGKHMTPTEFPRYPCDFWVSFMSGYGGNTVLLLPTGAVYYIFSDGYEFDWYSASAQIDKLKPMCK